MVMQKRKSNADADGDYKELSARNKRSRHIADDRTEDGDDEENEVIEEEEGQQLEEKFGGKVLNSIEASQAAAGRVAESGIIHSLELRNFMCHERLSFNFGPQLNFIVGHNGSGKSAVLTALTIALGGKAAFTGRASGLKSFIKEGKTFFEVDVRIHNEGSEAFQPEVYGHLILITRKVKIDGGSSYKIRNKDGKVVSTRQKDLVAICDHMNIQVDNPINILSQDSARQFLSASKPKEKYELFLKGTQLRQLSEEYELCRESCMKAERITQLKKEELPALKSAKEAATQKYRAAQKAMGTRERLGPLNQEKAWAHVAEKEAEMTRKIEEVEKEKRKADKVRRKVDDAEATYDRVVAEIVAKEEEGKDLGDIDDITKEKKLIDQQLTENKKQIQAIKSEKKLRTEERNRVQRDIDQRKREIAVEEAKLQVDKQEEQEERRRRLEAARKSLDEVQDRERSIIDQIRDVEGQLSTCKQSGAKIENDRTNTRNEMSYCNQQLVTLQKQAGNRLATFGTNMPQLLQSINNVQWHGRPPVGPLGMYVGLRDSSDRQWVEVMQITLGRMMSSFAITNARDRPQLAKLLQESRNYHMSIIVASDDEFDFRSGEPAPDVKTVLRELKITSEYVKRILINQNSIEKTALAKTRKEAEDLSTRVFSRVALSQDLYRVSSYGHELGRADGYSSSPLQKMQSNDPRKTYFLNDNPAAAKEQWIRDGRKWDEAFRRADEGFLKYQTDLARLNSRREALDRDARATSSRAFDLRQELNRLQQVQEDVPVNLAALQQAVVEAETERDNIDSQLGPIFESEKVLGLKSRDLMNQRDALRPFFEDYEVKKASINNEILKLVDEREVAKSILDKGQATLRGADAQIAELEAAAKIIEEEYELWTQQAENFCEGNRVQNPRLMKEIDREIDSIKKALERQAQEQGATLEEIADEVEKSARDYDGAKTTISEMSALNKMLKEAISLRINRWFEFRSHIALRTKMLFQQFLSQRGYYGKVIFNHSDQKLELKVQTADASATQGMSKDPKSLSGGEKSFSTICLLLALWDAVGCPIRCLDEFDVFMDAVNRRIAMKMMMEAATGADGKQFILITPQDVSALKFSPAVRVQRMVDPERGQTTLPEQFPNSSSSS